MNNIIKGHNGQGFTLSIEPLLELKIIGIEIKVWQLKQTGGMRVVEKPGLAEAIIKLVASFCIYIILVVKNNRFKTDIPIFSILIFTNFAVYLTWIEDNDTRFGCYF